MNRLSGEVSNVALINFSQLPGKGHKKDYALLYKVMCVFRLSPEVIDPTGREEKTEKKQRQRKWSGGLCVNHLARGEVRL